MSRQRRHPPRRRRGRFAPAYKLLSILAVAAAVVVACVVFFRVNQVTVQGNSRYTAEEIVAASGIRIGDNLIALSKSSAAGRIRAQLPYVEGVSIRRVLPDGVLLTVTERVAAASVEGETGRWLISSQGKLLEQSDTSAVMAVTGLTAVSPYAGEMLQVADGQEDTLTYALALLSELESREMLSGCTALDCTAATSFLLSYDIYRVKLPRTADYSKCLRLLAGALASDELPEDTPGTFDLTVADGRAYFTPDS